jgi:23S rRNA (pseudouridine1915-N3)-methyltransferase
LAELCEEYRKRIPWPIKVQELEDRRSANGNARKRREAQLLLGALPAGAFVIALDEHGTSYGSVQLAEKLRNWREQRGAIAFLIGGADGLAADLLEKSNARLSLGPLTWPHFLVRAMLLEQIYRAFTITAGHPYHRA